MARLARVVGKAEAAQPVGMTALKFILIFAAATAVVTLGWVFWPAGTQFNWQRYLRADADYAVELPGTPEITLEPQETEFGPTTMQSMQFVMQKPSAIFAVHYSPFPANSPFQKMTQAQADASLERYVTSLVAQLDGKLQYQSSLGQQAGFAREFRIEVPGERIYHGRMIYTRTAQYQLVVLAPTSAEIPPYVTKFFGSFEYQGTAPAGGS